MELLLIRHARPYHVDDPEGADPSLTEEGVGQATQLARGLAAGLYGPVDRLVSSPMRRARETADPIASALGLTVAVEDRIAELDRGWTRYGIPSDLYADRAALWRSMNSGRLGDNEFDVRPFVDRVVAGLEEVAASTWSRTAVVCHGGVVNVYLAHLIGAREHFFTDPSYTSVTRVRADVDGYRELLSVNETRHLSSGRPQRRK